ncbi:MAG TPA: phage-shock protein [Candidatus Hydrogenedentes bacterium]|nr:phage-shock protein [Candidatus Hydrogenedentota bacterium]
MHIGLLILIVLAVLAIPLAAILMPAILILGIVKIASGGRKGRTSRKLEAEETRLIQDIHKGLSKLAERVDALETILLDRETKGT